MNVAIATPLAQATAAGQHVAQTGGNAIDAALAAAGVLTVAYPHNCAIGGDLLALVRDPDGRVTFFNASGAAPSAADADALRATYGHMPLRGPHTITVPGMVGGWHALHTHGAHLPWAELLEPAVAATEGVSISRGLAESIEDASAQIIADPGWADVFAPDGTPLRARQALLQPALGRTLRGLQERGADDWYRGDLSQQLASGLSQLDVPITSSDLASFHVTNDDPLSLEIDGWQIRTAPPNSQGFLLLRILGALNRHRSNDPAKLTPLVEQQPLSTIARLFMQANNERQTLLSDPSTMTVDVRSLLTDESLDDFFRSAAHDGTRHQNGSSHAPRATGDTVAIAATDSEGRCVSLIQSLYDSFGSRVFEPTTGVLMHNRGACFSLDPSSPNCLAPGKRPLHTLMPVLVESEDTVGAVGTMGGQMQAQILSQVISQLLVGASPQESVSSPRWTVGPWDPDEPDDLLSYEEDLPAALREEIHRWPGQQTGLPPHHSDTGHSQVALLTPAGLSSGTDPRADGQLTP